MPLTSPSFLTICILRYHYVDRDWEWLGLKSTSASSGLMFARAKISFGDIVVGRGYVLVCGVWREPIVRDGGLAINSVLYLCIYVDL
jgi:hypothetical protein